MEETTFDIKKVTVHGPLVACDKPSPITGNIYPANVMREAVARFNEEKSKRGAKICGYVGNDAYPSGLLEITHTVDELSFNEDTNTVDATLTITDTPKGIAIKQAILYGTSCVGMILMGNANVDSKTKIVEDLNIITINLNASAVFNVNGKIIKSPPNTTQFVLTIDNIVPNE